MPRPRPKYSVELQEMDVFNETEVGWCEHTPINETMDDAGVASIQKSGFGAMDPSVPSRRRYDDPQVQDLRSYLAEENGIEGLEVCEPHELDRIANIFFRDGFVVVKDLLDEEMLALWRDGCARILRDILSYPGHEGRKYITETSRLPHRYSYGTASASRQLLHDYAWAKMVDLPTTTPILKRLFGSENYHVWGAGGDLCLPGAIEYQALHADLHESFQIPNSRLDQARNVGVDIGAVTDASDLDPRVREEVIEKVPPMITINFLMSDLTWENGPIRQIPGTHARAQRIPTQSEEPPWMRHSTLVGASAGAGMIRDNRGWHAATPNLSREVRALPDVEYGSPWMPTNRIARTMPYEVWESLSPHARKISQCVCAEPGVWPDGAGFMHPIAKIRRQAKEQDTKARRALA